MRKNWTQPWDWHRHTHLQQAFPSIQAHWCNNVLHGDPAQDSTVQRNQERHQNEAKKGTDVFCGCFGIRDFMHLNGESKSLLQLHQCLHNLNHHSKMNPLQWHGQEPVLHCWGGHRRWPSIFSPRIFHL